MKLDYKADAPTIQESLHLRLKPFWLPIYSLVQSELVAIAHAQDMPLLIVDVGGRLSPYTMGVQARVWITDLPRTTELQEELNLGATPEIIQKISQTRSNVERVVFDDMTHSALPSDFADCVVAVEVLEHVEEDKLFVREVQRILKPGGIFLMTTPNGDHIFKMSLDHKRHYTYRQLKQLLETSFESVTVQYAIRDSLFRTLGLHVAWPLTNSWRVLFMPFNLINMFQSRHEHLQYSPQKTCYLVAKATK
ncbi:MAG: class I SAM-dependent methyltransferase [Anaerolineae bacterium]|nr:class I SAM-dependent methyltransferase [Anaerolineae bacterium]